MHTAPHTLFWHIIFCCKFVIGACWKPYADRVAVRLMVSAKRGCSDRGLVNLLQMLPLLMLVFPYTGDGEQTAAHLFVQLRLQGLHFQHEVVSISCWQVNCPHHPL